MTQEAQAFLQDQAVKSEQHLCETISDLSISATRRHDSLLRSVMQLRDELQKDASSLKQQKTDRHLITVQNRRSSKKQSRI